MINKSELRLGNWVFGHDPQSMSYGVKKYFQVDEISEDGINCWRVEGFDSEYATFDPIPLTPEVLLAAGFQKNKWAEEYSRSLFGDYSLSFDEVLTFKCDDDFYNYNLTQIKYLHQLQNLIHSLTGTELEIDLIKAIK